MGLQPRRVEHMSLYANVGGGIIETPKEAKQANIFNPLNNNVEVKP